MPSVISLDGPRGGLGENFIGSFILRQGPVVGAALSLGLALVVGTALGAGGIWIKKRALP